MPRWSRGSPSASSRRRRRRSRSRPGRRHDRPALRGRRRGRARGGRRAHRRDRPGARLARRRPGSDAGAPALGERKATRKAVELAERHGVDLAVIEKRGFITEKDVEALIARQAPEATPSARSVLAGVSMERDAARALRCRRGRRDARRLVPRVPPGGSLRREVPVAGENGARLGEGVVLGDGSLVAAPRIVLADGVDIGPGATVRCEEVVAIGALTVSAPTSSSSAAARSSARRVGREVGPLRGGGTGPVGGARGRRPRVRRRRGVRQYLPVGREVFLTMRSLIVTHNIGHSVLEGFENRFAPVVLEDRSQVGLGAVVYAGCRIGAEAIVASGSYVTGDIPAGSFAIGVPAKVTGSSSHKVARAAGRARCADRRRPARAPRARRSRGVGDRGGDPRGFEVEGSPCCSRPRSRRRPGPAAVVLTLEARTEPPRRRRARPPRAARARERGRGARGGARALPQARNPASSRPVAVPRKPAVAGGPLWK